MTSYSRLIVTMALSHLVFRRPLQVTARRMLRHRCPVCPLCLSVCQRYLKYNRGPVFVHTLYAVTCFASNEKRISAYFRMSILGII